MGESLNFPIPIPKFWGQSGDGDKVLEKFWGFFGDGDGFDFEFFWGSIPENPQKTGMGTGIEPVKGLGILWGWGRLNLWGFFGGKSPKNLKMEPKTHPKPLQNLTFLRSIFGSLFLKVLELFRGLLGAFLGLLRLSWEASGSQKP